MDSGTVARIEEWDEESFSQGFSSLAQLAEREFSGAIRSGQTWLFVLNGRVVGTAGGSIDDFNRAGGTAFEAPHPALPLLFAMQEANAEPRARYFTDDTPLSEVHETLSSGNFTGYIELAENVHSGDYYLVYYGGRALTVAFVGGTERLLTDDEAFEQATDEVGIYAVRDVELDVRDLPEPEAPPAGGAESSEESNDQDDTTESEPSAPVTQAADEDDVESKTGDSQSTEARESGAVQNADTAPDDTRTEEREAATQETPPDTATDDRIERDSSTSESSTKNTGSGVRTPEGVDPFSEEQAWRETRAVPALDPNESGESGRSPRSGATESASAHSSETSNRSQQATTGSAADGGQEGKTDDVPAEKVQELEAELSELRGRLDDVEDERNELREERDTLERRLENRDIEDDSDRSDDHGISMTDRDALDQTDLLVRYGSKSDATLADAHNDVNVTDHEVDANLRLETHTRFDAEDVTVGGHPYESFVKDTLEYRFAAWVARSLLFEIRDTGNADALGDLYDAIPEIDRVEFGGAVSMRDDEGEEVRESFDVVFRNQMGQPIAVADLNDDRDPATGDMMADLLEAATTVADGQDALSAAFSVTASFFAPEALETADEATNAGLLNRDARKSFVKTARKQGYHLCLVEAHGDEFRLAVPDL